MSGDMIREETNSDNADQVKKSWFSFSENREITIGFNESCIQYYVIAKYLFSKNLWNIEKLIQ